MNPIKIISALICIPLCAFSKDLYHVKHLSEREMLRTYTDLMVDAYRYSDKAWKAAAFDSTAGYWGDGASNGNEGVRAIGEMVFVSGVLLKYTDALSPTERTACLEKARAAIRFATATHVTGAQKCLDKKQWGDTWQSAMWAGTLGFGVWLIGDQLDQPIRNDVERVIAFECNRFTNRPPGGTLGDTKAEENGWNLICLSLAANMFPDNPKAAAWKEKAIEYAINTLSVPQDRGDQTRVDGKSVSEWFSGENLYPEYTLENHGFFHPAYVACSSYFLTQTAMHFVYAHRPIPQSATHHLLDVWQMFQRLMLPYGEPAYPQGMDWELHGITMINLYASLATYQKDPLAARLEQSCLQYMRTWQNMENGNLAVPGSRLGFTRHAICAEQAAYGFLAHKIFGPATKEISTQKFVERVNGARTLDSVGIVFDRTADKFVSFSWKNRLGGMVMPIGKGHDEQPHFTVPIPNGLIGSFDLAPVGDRKIKVLDHSWKTSANGFETTGTLLLDGEHLKQTVKITSIGEHTVVYQDRVVALQDVTVTREQGVPLGIENDKITGGARKVFHQEGTTEFEWLKPRKPERIPGIWANVDDRLGIVQVAGSGISYTQATGYHPGMAVCADVLCGSSRNGPKHFKAGDEVARRVMIIFADVSAKKTAALAKLHSQAAKANGQVLRLKLPEGGAAEVPML